MTLLYLVVIELFRLSSQLVRLPSLALLPTLHCYHFIAYDLYQCVSTMQSANVILTLVCLLPLSIINQALLKRYLITIKY